MAPRTPGWTVELLDFLRLPGLEEILEIRVRPWIGKLWSGLETRLRRGGGDDSAPMMVDDGETDDCWELLETGLEKIGNLLSRPDDEADGDRGEARVGRVDLQFQASPHQGSSSSPLQFLEIPDTVLELLLTDAGLAPGVPGVKLEELNPLVHEEDLRGLDALAARVLLATVLHLLLNPEALELLPEQLRYLADLLTFPKPFVPPSKQKKKKKKRT